MNQTEHHYCYATLYNQECTLYGFHQHNLTNEQYYERLNTKVDVGESISITMQHRVLMEDMSHGTFKKRLTTLVKMKERK